MKPEIIYNSWHVHSYRANENKNLCPTKKHGPLVLQLSWKSISLLSWNQVGKRRWRSQQHILTFPNLYSSATATLWGKDGWGKERKQYSIFAYAKHFWRTGRKHLKLPSMAQYEETSKCTKTCPDRHWPTQTIPIRGTVLLTSSLRIVPRNNLTRGCSSN